MSAEPSSISFELYRGNAIETFDTCALRAECEGIPLLFLVSHTVDDVLGPKLDFVFEKATVSVQCNAGDDKSNLVAHFNDGATKVYGDFQDGRCSKIQYSIDMITKGAPSINGIEASLPQLRVIQEFHKDPAFIHTIKAEIKEYRDQGILHYVPGMFEELQACYEENKLPSELGLAWASSPITKNL